MCCYFVQVFYKLIRRYKYLEKAFEDEVRKVSTFTACQWNQCSWACSPLKIMMMIRVWKFWTTILQCVCCAEGVLIRSPASQLDCVDNLIFAFSSCCFCSGCDCLKVLRGVCLNHDSRRLLPSLDICVCSFAGCRMVCHVLYYFAFISRAWNSLKHLTGPN